MREPDDISSLRIAVLSGQQRSNVENVVRGLPAGLGLAVIVPCGGSPDLASRLRALSALPIVEVRGAARLERDHIYVVPADHEVVLHDDQIVVEQPTTAPLDERLCSLAATQGHGPAVVLLSGLRVDGGLGMRLRAALATAPLVMLTLDENLEIAWGVVHGKELGPGDTKLADLLASGQGERLEQVACSVLAAGVGKRIELDVPVAGELRTYEFRIEPIASWDSLPASGAAEGRGVTAVGFDITAGKVAEDTLRNTDRRKDELLATLSHELRNPLTPLKVALDVANMPGVSADQLAEAHRIMGRQVEQLTQLVDNLLDLSRIAQGRFRLERTTIDPAHVVESAVEAVHMAMQNKQQSLHLELPAGSPRVIGDESRLSRVVVNLLANASRYTPEGGKIQLVVEADRARRVLVMRVRDSGIAISSDALPHVFDLFVQGRSPDGLAQGALGIELNLVKRIVEAHGGQVSAHSNLDSGSELVVELPLANA